jgi:threonine dehydrogenase-like Zn-dependent dehydrogenase
VRAVRGRALEDAASTRYPIPRSFQQDDVIVKVTATAICGSDLH